MSLNILSDGVISHLRSGIAITCPRQCVEELVLNSLDAKATCIAIRVNFKHFNFQVVDNGFGLSKDQLNLIGERYATSKCHSIHDLERIETFGYRGEALASIIQMCGIFKIESRTRESQKTYCKIFNLGKALGITESKESRVSVGTTCTVTNFLYNLPVRKKSVEETLDFEDIRFRLQSVALIHPQVSFSLRDDISGATSLRIRRCNSVFANFSQIFGSSRVKNLKSVRKTLEFLTVEGYVSTNDDFHNKNLQFVYVNKRLVFKSKLHKVINSFLVKNHNFSQMEVAKDKKKNYAIFVLNISCPTKEYDISFDPSKTYIEFKDWDKVIKCVMNAINEVIVNDKESSSRKELIIDENESIPVDNPDLLEIGAQIATHDLKNALISLPAKRNCLINVDNSSPVKRSRSLSPEVEDKNQQEVLDNLPENPQRKILKIPQEFVTTSYNDFIKKTQNKSGEIQHNVSQDEILMSPSRKLLQIPKEFVTTSYRNFIQRVNNDIDEFQVDAKSPEPLRINWKNSSFPRRKITVKPINQSTLNNIQKFSFDKVKSKSKLKNLSPIPTNSVKRINDEVSVKYFSKPKSSIVPQTKSIFTSSSSFIRSFKENSSGENVKSSSSELLVEQKLGFDKRNIFYESSSGESEVKVLSKRFDKEECATVVCESSTILDLDNSFSRELIEENKKSTVPILNQTSFDLTEGDEIVSSGSTQVYLSSENDEDVQEIKEPFDQDGTESSFSPKLQTSLISDHIEDLNSSNQENDSQKKSELHPEDNGCESLVAETNQEIPEEFSCNQNDHLKKTENNKEEEKSDWIIQRDDNLGKNIYIHKISGNSFFDTPIQLGMEDTKELPVVPRAFNLGLAALPFTNQEHSVRPSKSDDLECEDVGDSLSQLEDELFGDARFTTSNFQPAIADCDPVNPCRFSRSMLNQVQVVGQVDKKFIACLLPSPDNASRLMVLFDQHAVHERVRLEQLQADLETEMNCTEPKLKVTRISPCKKIFCELIQINVVRAFLSSFARWGFELNIDQDSNIIEVHTIPVILAQREANVVCRNRSPVLASLIENVIQDIISLLQSTGSANVTMPKTMLRVLNSFACRGAIKFGQKLENEECKQLISLLRNCRLPFQCAHGRPSVAALVDYEKVKHLGMKKEWKKPHFENIRQIKF